MNPLLLHLLFDLGALVFAVAVGFVVYRSVLPRQYKHPMADGYSHYLFWLSLGSLSGATLLGSLNLWVSGMAGVGRSILGAILGAIVAVEWYKAHHGIRESTGVALVVPLGLGIAVGRIGCFLTGLPDYTYGTATNLPWGWDFGDSVIRHPVQLYESISLALATGLFLILLKKNPPLAMRTGFYWFVAWYAVQRFALEFLKPYGGVLGPLNVFHFGSLLLLAYAVFMLKRGDRAHA